MVKPATEILCRFFFAKKPVRSGVLASEILEDQMNNDVQSPSTYRRRNSPKRPIWCFVLLANLLYLPLASSQIVGTGQLTVERRSHSATLLENGKVLIVGGDNQNGIVSQAEIFDPISQTSALAAALIAPRTDHSATILSDGSVMVIGGRDQNSSLQSTEIYKPLTTSFVAGPAMMRARSGHTATILANDKILVTGGDLFGSAEIYDPATQSFSLVPGTLNIPRKFHSAILLQNGQVMIVGGVNAQEAMLNTAEIFDSASQTFYLPPTDMQTARAFATLKLLSDGKVQIIGGDAELSMEVFNPSNGIFIAKALLPPNPDLLGATLSTHSRAALFSPTIAQDPLLQGILTAEQLSLLDRADQSITELPSRNQALVAGGVNSTGQVLNSAKLVSSSKASVTTDKTDYAPGQIVTITGSGFQPNEQVHIYFHEFPEEYPDVFLSAVTNQQGGFVVAEFAPQEIDVGRVFTLTALGQSSGFTAQTAFKDNKNLTLTKAGTGTGTVTSTTSSVGGGSINCGVTCTSVVVSFGDTDTVTLTAAPTSGSVLVGWSFSSSGGDGPPSSPSAGCSSAGTTCTFGMGNKKQEVTATFNAAAAVTTTAINAPTVTYGTNGSVTVIVSSAVGTPTGNVTLSVDGGTPVSKVLSGGSAIFTSTDITALTSPNAGDHSLSASYSTQGNFAASAATGNLHVNKASSTTTVTFETGPYTYRGTAFTATAVVTGVGGLNQTVAVVYSGDCTNVTSANGCTATASFAGDTNHNGSNDSKSITINKRSITVTADAKTKTYSESDPPLTYQVTSGSLALSDAFTGALSRVAGELVGTYAIQQNTLSITNVSNYILTYIGGNLTITTGFAFNGFQSPIGGSVENADGGTYANPVKSFKLGSTIPVKFAASWLNDGAALISGIHTLKAIKYSNSTDSDPPIDATPTDAATTGNQFRLTSTDWHFNLSTKGNGFTAGTWLLSATLVDGSQHTVWISIKK